MKKTTQKQDKVYVRGVAAAGLVATLGFGIATYSFASQLEETKNYLILAEDEVASLKKGTVTLLSEVESLEAEKEEKDTVIKSLESDLIEHKNSINELSEEKKELESENNYLGKKLAALKEEADLKAANRTHNITQNERELLARVLYHESRGEPENGQIGVVNVLLNRLDHDWYPNTISEIVYQPNQISHVHELANHPVLPELLEVVDKALESQDNTNGAVFWWNSDIATCRWLDSRTPVAKLGSHTFLK